MQNSDITPHHNDTSDSSSTVQSITQQLQQQNKKNAKSFLKTQLEEEKQVLTTEHLLELSKDMDPENSIRDKFTLASLYAKSTNRTLLQQAEVWLKELLQGSYHRELGDEYKRDCCFLLGWANFQMGEYTEARRYAEKLVLRDPGNYQAVEFVELIDERIRKEGTKGLILGGVGLAASAAVFGTVGLVGAALLMRRAGRR